MWSVLIVSLIWPTWLLYQSTFANRPRRSSEKCPSHYRRPEAGLHVSARWETPSTKLTKRNTLTINPEAPAGHHVEVPTLLQQTNRSRAEATSKLSRAKSEISDLATDRLHMDHLPLSFTDLLWCSFFLLPPAFAAFVVGGASTYGLLGILTMKMLQHLGCGKTTCSDDEASNQVCEFILGTASLVIWVTGVDDETGTATFLFPNTTRIVSSTEVETGDFEVRLDLKARRQLSATFDDEAVGAHDSLALLMNAVAGNVHPVVHSFANWGLNTGRQMHWFIRRMACITIKYNNIGVESYPAVMNLLRWFGLVSLDINDITTRLTCYVHHNVPNHRRNVTLEGRGCPFRSLGKLRPHSEMVEFIFKVRIVFLSEFIKHQNDFPGIDGEAHFIGTVMHSVDHRNAGRTVDNRVFTGKHPNKAPIYAATHEWASIAHACATDRPPLRMFDCSFKRAGHPFYRKVYKYAEKINTRLASYMETCIAM